MYVGVFRTPGTRLVAADVVPFLLKKNLKKRKLKQMRFYRILENKF